MRVVLSCGGVVILAPISYCSVWLVGFGGVIGDDWGPVKSGIEGALRLVGDLCDCPMGLLGIC